GQVLEVAAQEAVAPLLELGRELLVDQLQHGSQTTAGPARRLGGTTVGRGPVSHDLVPFPSSRHRWRERSPTSCGAIRCYRRPGSASCRACVIDGPGPARAAPAGSFPGG